MRSPEEELPEVEEPLWSPRATLPKVLASWELRVLARESLTWGQATVVVEVSEKIAATSLDCVTLSV